MSEDDGEYKIEIQIKGKRKSGHFLCKTIEEMCDWAENCLDVKIDKQIVLRK